MLTISKPLSADQAQRYHAEEFENARDNYYTVGDRIHGTWHGQLCSRWQLSGEVHQEHFQRLANGQDPWTGDALVRIQPNHTYTDEAGRTVTAMAHRAGWDATFSAPKTVSLTALVGGDARVREAHEASVTVALDELERYVQARIGGAHPAETAGRWVAARFEHDSARPVDGYAAPQLHTHVVVFNVTETDAGLTRALQPRELYKTQAYATAVYRSELAMRLERLGYTVERGAHDQPEIAGYTAEYVEASSPRRRDIEAYLTDVGRSGAAAAQIAAHHTRASKLDVSPEAVQQQHRALAEAFGDQPRQVVRLAQESDRSLGERPPRITARAAVTFAIDRNLERAAVVDERAIMRDALVRSMGERTVAEIEGEIDDRVNRAGLVQVEPRLGAAARVFTTPEMIDLERDTIAQMRRGQGQYPLLAQLPGDVETVLDHHGLSDRQRVAVDAILANQDRVVALEGVAGGGKTTTLAAIRDVAVRNGYEVFGLAPTSRAAQHLDDAGIPSTTLQRHVLHPDESVTSPPRLYVLDEASLASTRQMHALLQNSGPTDRVLLVGDVRQHQAVEAGRPYQQLQVAGMQTVRLDQIVRQKDEALKHVVEQLARGEIGAAVQQLDSQGRVHEIIDGDERFRAIGRAYMEQPERTLVISPDNASRMRLNEMLHREMQAAGRVDRNEHRVSVLVPRQDLTGADRQWASRYEVGDVLRYTRGSRPIGLEAGTYARVEHVRERENLLTAQSGDGHSITYDPRRLQGVTVYRESTRAFAVGDRVQLTSPIGAHHVANRVLGTIDRIDATGSIRVSLDAGRHLTLGAGDPLHLDYGYAVTSHSSQGQTADRVLIQLDVGAGEALVNRRLAYVAVSRARHDVQIYTNDKDQLGAALSRDISNASALDQEIRPSSPEYARRVVAVEQKSPQRTIGQTITR
jgi:conjugative relaxase-like TrwC/TraI family protein